ncbi:TonB-dependent siderophore receptor, partial [Candidatus Cyanaurora vandensis]
MSHLNRKNRRAACLLNLAVVLVCLGVLTRNPVSAEPALILAQNVTEGGRAQDLTGPVPLSVAQVTPTDEADDEPVDLLSEVNVTALRRRVTERENTQTTYVVTREDIQAAGATTVADALRLIPSIRFTDDLGGVDTTGFNQVRGLDDTRFILLQDGRPLTRASNNRAANISKLPTANVERIEVVTGGSSLRYGADAIGGVINVITQIPAGPPKVTALVNFGSYGFSQYLLDYSGSNSVDPSEAGYFGYQLGYERRSVLNNFNQTVSVTAPAGGFVRFASVTPDAQSFSSTTPAFGFYSYSDLYYGKAIFKPGREHTITLAVQQQNTRRGYAFYYGPNCRFRPQGNVSGGGYVAPKPYFYCYDKAYYDGRTVAYDAPYDLRIDDTGINLNWDWNLTELNTLSTQVSYNNSWENYPSSSGQRYLNNRTLEAQLRYNAELYPGNILNTGFQFLSNRSIQVPFIGAPLN